jgi:Flp pilus assembly protein TadG
MLGRYGRDARGASAAEFALVAPVFCLMFAGMVDFGSAIYTRFSLNSAVSAAANYTILNATQVTSSNGAALAQNLGEIIASAHAANWANATIVVNNGPTATLTGGALTTGGTASGADLCYCPTVSGSTVSWGNSTSCGATCAGGGLAGKFVSIVATANYTSPLSSISIIPSSIFTTASVVETQ